MAPFRSALAFALLLAAWPAHADRVLYGPGPHWIASVQAGTAMFESSATVGVDLDGDGATDLSFDATGPTQVVRSAARQGTHLDLEIFSMVLTGSVPGLGPFTLRLGDGVPNLASDGPLHSRGTSDEIPGDPRRARDVFELFFRVELGGLVLHNVVPFRVEATIDRLPPIGSEFRFVGAPVPLVDDAGMPVLQITATVNRIERPPPRPCDPPGEDASALAAARFEMTARCGCSLRTPAARKCRARVLRTRVRAGILNRRCGRALRCRGRAGDDG